MMCMPASIALAFAPASTSSVSYVAATGANYVTSGTTINTPSTPAGVATGDGLFAIVFARSTLTPPAGWTLVESQLNSGSGFTQTLYIYRRDSAGSGDSSTAFTWTQSASGRLGLAYVLARSTTGALTVAQSSTLAPVGTVSGGIVNIACPTLTATTAGELFVLAASSIYVAANPDLTTLTAPPGATLRTTAAVDQNRMAVATQALDNSQSNSTPFTLNGLSTGTYKFTSLAVRLQVA